MNHFSIKPSQKSPAVLAKHKNPDLALRGESLLRLPLVLGGGVPAGRRRGSPAGARSRCVRGPGHRGLPGRRCPGGAAQGPHTSEGTLVRQAPLGVSRESRPRPPTPAAPLPGSLGRSPHCALLPGARPACVWRWHRRPRAVCSFPSPTSLSELCPVTHGAAGALRRGPPRYGRTPSPPALAKQGFKVAPPATMFRPWRGPWPASMNLSGR